MLRSLPVSVMCFLAAVAVYAFWGSPTPDNPGLAEFLTGFFLLGAVGIAGAWRAVRLEFSVPLWESAGRLLLLYGLTLPLVTGALAGAGGVLILRDILPFLFFLLPVFFAHHKNHGPLFMTAIAGLGIVFALRSLRYSYPFTLFLGAPEELFYFANAPTVLFAALFCLGLAGEKILRAGRLKDWGGPVLLLVLALVPLAAMALSVQRATLGAAALYVLLLLGGALWAQPRRAVRLIAFLALPVCAAFPFISGIWEMLSQKTFLVGLNMRFQEIAAVWNVITENPFTLFLGTGWGGVFHSPAVGGMAVNYTHSLLSYMALKTGLVGLGLTLAYLAGMAGCLVRLVFLRPALGLALAAPFLISVLFYASFKSLDFGLVLLLIPAGVVYERERKK